MVRRRRAASGSTPQTALVSFTYDARKRLIHETRVVDETQTVYNLMYEYDQLGNRTRQVDGVHERQTCYVYDTDWDLATQAWRPGLCYTPAGPLDPNNMTRNNRLLEYREYGPDGYGGYRLERTVRYTYYLMGHVAHISLKDEWLGVGDPPPEYWKWYDLYLTYGSNESLWLAVWQEWVDGWTPPTWPDDITVTDAWEFRYETGRERYLARQWNVEVVEGYPQFTPAGTPTWTDYLAGGADGGPYPYVDYSVGLDPNDQPAATEIRRYFVGEKIHAQEEIFGQAGQVRYLHGDLIDATMLTTDEVGQPVYPGGTAGSAVVPYTAFGEAVVPDGQGGWRVAGDCRRWCG